MSFVPDWSLWLHLLGCGVLMAVVGTIARYVVMKRWNVSVSSKEFVLIAALVLSLLIGTGMARDLLLSSIYSSLFIVGYFTIKVVRYLRSRKSS